MPHLHFHIFLFVDRIWALLATGATEFSNINVVSGNRPIGDLNVTHHRKAIGVLRALINQITLPQSQGTPIMVQASVTTKYCPMLAISAHLPKLATSGANASNSANPQDTKCNPATPDRGINKTTNRESNKKVKVVKTRGVNKKEMGMFYLKNAEARATDIFPRDLAQKVCADFTCKGKECTREPCSFMHP